MTKAQLIAELIRLQVPHKKSWNKAKLLDTFLNVSPDNAIEQSTALEINTHKKNYALFADLKINRIMNTIIKNSWHKMSTFELEQTALTKAKEDAKNGLIDISEINKKAGNYLWYINDCLDKVKNIESYRKQIIEELKWTDMSANNKLPLLIEGNWKEGWALSLHTLKSTLLDNGRFQNTYSEIGGALNKLKYHGDYTQIEKLANKVINFLKSSYILSNIDVIIPTPPSKNRYIQPVEEISKLIGKRLNISIDTNYIVKTKNTTELKGIDDFFTRKTLLKGAFTIQNLKYINKNILLFDDLFRSGSTLREITETLYKNGHVNNVYVITLTKTRSKR